MKIRKNLCGLPCSELEQLMVTYGKKPFHGRQLFKWIYKNLVNDFYLMTDIAKDIQAILDSKYQIRLPQIANIQESSDGTRKFLLSLDDGQAIEAVLIPDDNSGRTTLCISSQVGCALNCGFCATGQAGYKRDLTVGEIIGQAMVIREKYGMAAFDNVVFMGMGEPLLNYDNVMASIDIMTDSLGMMIGAKRITISTAGIVPGIIKLAKTGSKVNLAVSLNAPNNNLRSRLMPIAKSYNLAELMEAVKVWTSVRKRRVTFEYIIFKGFNDSREYAMELAELIRGIPCKINLLAYNPVEGFNMMAPDIDDMDAFAKILYPRAPAVTVRQSRGGDICAACGQLAGKKGYK